MTLHDILMRLVRAGSTQQICIVLATYAQCSLLTSHIHKLFQSSLTWVCGLKKTSLIEKRNVTGNCLGPFRAGVTGIHLFMDGEIQVLEEAGCANSPGPNIPIWYLSWHVYED